MADFQKTQDSINEQKKSRRRPPEFDFWDALKGKRVCFVLGVDHERRELGPMLLGTLVWVDRFMVGVRTEGVSPLMKQDQVVGLNKGQFVLIGEAA